MNRTLIAAHASNNENFRTTDAAFTTIAHRPPSAMATSDAVEQGDESSQWTQVVRKGKGKKLGRRQHTAHPPVAGATENFQPNSTPQLSVDDIKANHDKIASKWISSRPHSRLCEVVKANAASHAPITRAVCLGLGAFDPEDGSWVAQRRSHVQMAAFLSIVDVLRKESGNEIECLYQEPRFAQPDKDFISSMHGKVVESPESYQLINETTLVFGVHLYRDIWADALQKSLPGMFVGTGWDVWEVTPGSEKSSDFERIQEMDASFGKFAFPQDEHSSFSSTCIYWKKRDGHNGALTDSAGSQASDHENNVQKRETNKT